MNKPQRENVVQEGRGTSPWLVYVLLLLFIAAFAYDYFKSNSGSGADSTNSIESPVQAPTVPATAASPGAELYAAVVSGNTEQARSMLARLSSGDVNRVINGMTPLMKAASMGRLDLVELLLAHGGDPNKRGAAQRTALQYAAERNRLAVAKLLIKHGADINGVDNTRLSPLVMAADRRYHELAIYLIEAGADVNIQHVQGWTALIDASRTGDLKLVRRLIQAGADPKATTSNGWTALDYARHYQHLDVEQFLRNLQRATP